MIVCVLMDLINYSLDYYFIVSVDTYMAIS